MSRVLCVTYGAGHAQIVASVVPKLVERGHEVVVMALTTAAGLLARKGISSLGYVDFIEPGDAEALETGKRLAAGHPPHPDVRPGETEAYLGICYSELVADHGAERAASLYASNRRQAFLPKRFMRRVIDKVQPDLVLATNSPRSEQAAIEVAAEAGVPSVVVLDLMVCGNESRLRRPGYGTKVCVLADLVRKALIDAGRQPEEVVVTGNPAFDEMGGPQVAVDAAHLRENKGWRQDKVILWASQPEPTDPDWGAKIARTLAKAVGTRPGWRLVYRPHPNERPGADALDPGIETSGRDDDLAALLKAVDAVVVVSSTVGLQAALMGKLLVQVDLPVSAGPIDYPSVGAGHWARDLDHCLELLDAHVARPVVGDLPFPPLGSAADRVAELADELVLQRAR